MHAATKTFRVASEKARVAKSDLAFLIESSLSNFQRIERLRAAVRELCAAPSEDEEEESAAVEAERTADEL